MKKSLKDWLAEGSLRTHDSSRAEVSGLLNLVRRDLADAAVADLSPDRAFAIAYNAILQLATITLRVSGYRTAGTGHHWLTIQMLLEILGAREQGRVDFFDSCRRRRNIADYDTAGTVSQAQLQEILREAHLFQDFVLLWLRTNRPDLV